MEAAVAMFSALGGGGTLVNAGLAVETAAGGFAASEGLLSAGALISGTFTGVSALATIGSANLQAAALEEEALFSDFNARAELLAGKAEAVEELKALNEVVSQNIVSGFASGLRGSGNVAQASLDAIAEGEFQLDLTRDAAAVRSAGNKAQGRASKTSASATRTSGVVTAAGTVASAFDRQGRRGG